MNILKYVPVLMLVLLLSSCLKSGLDELPAFEDAEVTNFNFEYRWIDNSNDFGQLRVVQLEVVSTISEGNRSIECSLTVPPENGDFTAAIRNQVELSNLVGYADISVAAILKPMGNSPELGIPGDFSQSGLEYEVLAADGKTKKVWTLNITNFIK